MSVAMCLVNVCTATRRAHLAHSGFMRACEVVCSGVSFFVVCTEGGLNLRKSRRDVLSALNVTISVCAKGREWAWALSLLAEARLSCVDLDRITFNSAIDACEKGGQWERALSLVEDHTFFFLVTTHKPFWAVPAHSSSFSRQSEDECDKERAGNAGLLSDSRHDQLQHCEQCLLEGGPVGAGSGTLESSSRSRTFAYSHQLQHSYQR